MINNFIKFKKKYFLIFIICVIIYYLIKLNLIKDNDVYELFTDNKIPNFTTFHSNNYIYDIQGNLKYQILSKKTIHFSTNKLSWLYKPVLITFIDKNPIWIIYANKAKLTKEHILYLYGNIQYHSLIKSAFIEKIKTNSVIINFVNQDITSKDKVVLYGKNFYSISNCFTGNLQKNIITFKGKVKTYYAINIPEKKN
ncbi:MAG: LPS export ABC transporter periplasmic protein LptC [Pantoea sp. Brub]|nr:LPS export ABC transporter periplasmic protein LptC [Pantoea sp. Brub]